MAVKRLRNGFGIQIPVTSLLLCLVCGGCTSPGKLARTALQAPNQHIKFPREFRQLDSALNTNFSVERITVGPPPATLELMVLE
ncbi:MAG: hypothetical protein ACREDQ_14155, partial [Limisphaerales bacterium]